uniref:Nucleolar protein 11 n=1 Tax=Denticeps clupeoides TaxID=299321 RepID=A0AAY4A930_9TELE
MAALYEATTLCVLNVGPGGSDSGISGIEPSADDDQVVVTDSARSVTVYKVSDKKALGSWTVKQGQTVTCPAIYNPQTSEYVVVTDSKVIRVWKDSDINIDRAFKTTVSADVWRVLSVPDSEPLVLFQRGAVRRLDTLLADPQQPVENVLPEEAVIRWSAVLNVEQQPCLMFLSEQKGETLLLMQRRHPDSAARYRLEGGEAPLSCSALPCDGGVRLFCLYSSGSVYESVVPIRGAGGVVEEVQPLPRTLLLNLPVGEGKLESASAVSLDDAHVALVGVPHPSAGPGKDFLCIWNTNFQTLQAAKEMAGRIYGQLWCSCGKLYVPHGKSLSVIPFKCQKSSLAAAMGKLRQAGSNVPASGLYTSVPSWTAATPDMRSTKRTLLRSRDVSFLRLNQFLEDVKIASAEEVQKKVSAFLSNLKNLHVIQVAAGGLASVLVSRCQEQPGFYPHSALVQLVHSQCLSYSVCPHLLTLALEKKDYALCQFCLQVFPDIPEAVACSCLKAFLSESDGTLDTVSLERDSVAFVEGLIANSTQEGGETQQNGFCPTTQVEDGGGGPTHTTPAVLTRSSMPLDMKCPVGLHKAVLLNEILQVAYSDCFLLLHLKTLSAPQVILFLQYLQFLYGKYSQDLHTQVSALRSPAMTQVCERVISCVRLWFFSDLIGTFSHCRFWTGSACWWTPTSQCWLWPQRQESCCPTFTRSYDYR